MQAPASPRRPTRLRQRTLGSLAAISFTAAAVPSGELSSTKMASQAGLGQGQIQTPQQFGDIAALLEGRDDDGKFGGGQGKDRADNPPLVTARGFPVKGLAGRRNKSATKSAG